MLLETFSSVSAETVLETFTYVVNGGSQVEDTPTVDPPLFFQAF